MLLGVASAPARPVRSLQGALRAEVMDLPRREAERGTEISQ